MAKTFTLRGSSQYLHDKHGLDISELRMRTLVNQHEVFAKDENTSKQKGETEQMIWRVSQKALDDYAKVAKTTGSTRSTTGAKAYKVSVTTEQLASLRAWAQANGVADPERANKAYVKKSGAPADGGAVGSDNIAAAFSEGGEEDDGLFDEVEEDEAVEA